jgi:hypothetical protein
MNFANVKNIGHPFHQYSMGPKVLPHVKNKSLYNQPNHIFSKKLFVPFSNRIYPCNDKQEMDKDEI